MTQEIYNCFLCCGKANATILNDPVTTDFSSLSNNLNVIFVLRKVLQIPSLLLETELNENGQDPHTWIRLCDQCTYLTKKGRKLQEQICSIEKQLKCVQKQVVEKFKRLKCSQQNFDNLKQKAYHNRDSLTFEDKISLFVKTNNYPYKLEDDDNTAVFLEGDKLANHLASQQNSKILLVQNDAKESIKVEVDSPQSSPPPPPEDSLDDSVHSSDDDNDNDVDYKIKVNSKNLKKRTPSKSTSTTSRKTKAVKDDNESSHKCPHCGKEFPKRKTLYSHVRYVHIKSFKITCSICGKKSFQSNRHKEIHMLTIHKDDPLTLKLKEEKGIFFKRCSKLGCSKRFLTKEQEDKHMITMHSGGGDDKVPENKVGEDGRVLCGECGKWYSDWMRWTNHTWRGHQGRELTCLGEECEMVFKVAGVETKKEFKDHFEMVHETKKIVCNVCGEETSNRKELKKHKWFAHHT